MKKTNALSNLLLGAAIGIATTGPLTGFLERLALALALAAAAAVLINLGETRSIYGNPAALGMLRWIMHLVVIGAASVSALLVGVAIARDMLGDSAAVVATVMSGFLLLVQVVHIAADWRPWGGHRPDPPQKTND